MNLNTWYIDRKNTHVKRKYVIRQMNHRYLGRSCKGVLPPIFFKETNKLSDDEVRLLDNLIFMFVKGEESECHR